MTNPRLYDVFNITDLRVGMTINLTSTGEVHAGNDYVVEGEDEDFGFYVTLASGTRVYVADTIPGDEVNVLLNDFTWYEIRTHGPTFELFTEDVDGFTEHVWATPSYSSSFSQPSDGEEVSSYNITGMNFSGFHIYPGQIDSVIALLEAIKERHNG